MFLKFWIISTVICLILYFSTVFSILREMKKKFTKEELKGYNKQKSGYAWYVNVFLLTCPILNIILVLVIGFNYGEIKEKELRKVRKANGKQTTADVVSEVFDKLLNK